MVAMGSRGGRAAVTGSWVRVVRVGRRVPGKCTNVLDGDLTSRSCSGLGVSCVMTR